MQKFEWSFLHNPRQGQCWTWSFCPRRFIEWWTLIKIHMLFVHVKNDSINYLCSPPFCLASETVSRHLLLLVFYQFRQKLTNLFIKKYINKQYPRKSPFFFFFLRFSLLKNDPWYSANDRSDPISTLQALKNPKTNACLSLIEAFCLQ